MQTKAELELGLAAGTKQTATWQHLYSAGAQLALPWGTFTASHLQLDVGPTRKQLSVLCVPCRSEVTALWDLCSMCFGYHFPLSLEVRARQGDLRTEKKTQNPPVITCTFALNSAGRRGKEPEEYLMPSCGLIKSLESVTAENSCQEKLECLSFSPWHAAQNS